jgi:hypothetical protein
MPCSPPENIGCALVLKTPRFLWRPPIIPDNTIYNEEISWTTNQRIIDSGYVNERGRQADNFERVLGPASTNSYGIQDSDFGIISANKLEDGTYVMFYDKPIDDD